MLSTGLSKTAGGNPAGGVGYAASHAGAPIAANDIDRVGFANVQGSRVDAADRTAVDQGNLYRLAADRQRRGLRGVGEAELKGDRFGPGACVVDMDLVQRVRVEHVEVRAALRILEGDVVGEDRHVGRASGFVAAKHVEIGAVDGRVHGDAGRLAVARRPRCGGGCNRSQRNAQLAERTGCEET